MNASKSYAKWHWNASECPHSVASILTGLCSITFTEEQLLNTEITLPRGVVNNLAYLIFKNYYHSEDNGIKGVILFTPLIELFTFGRYFL